jgi:DNA-binding GntR family transcriptional regulator
MTWQSADPARQGAALALRRASCVTPVRAALRRLESGGADAADSPATSVTAADLESVEGTYVARMLIEPYAVQRASLRISRRDAVKLGALAGRIADARAEGNGARASIANYDFHFALYDRCGLAAIPHRIRELWSAYPWDILHVLRSPAAVEREHRAIADAVVDGDAHWIASAVEDHIAGGYRDLVLQLGGEYSRDPFELGASS